MKNLDIGEISGQLVDEAIRLIEETGENLLPIEQDMLFDSIHETLEYVFPPALDMHEDESDEAGNSN